MELEEFRDHVGKKAIPVEKRSVTLTDEKIFEKAVNPSHYMSTSIECIDAMTITFGSYVVCQHCLVNAYKYIWRCRHKNGLEDLYKAKWYLAKAVELDQDLIGDTQWMALTAQTNKMIFQLKEENGKG